MDASGIASATPAIRDHVGAAGSKAGDMDHKGRYDAQCDVCMSWAHRRMIEAGDKGKASANKTDVGGMSGPPEWMPEEMNGILLAAMMKGKGKGK